MKITQYNGMFEIRTPTECLRYEFRVSDEYHNLYENYNPRPVLNRILIKEKCTIILENL